MYTMSNITTIGSGGVSRAARTALIVIGFFLGTGSVSAAPGPDLLHSYFKPKLESKYTVSEKYQIKAVGLDLRTPDDHLGNIKSVLNLPVSEMASIFGVTRQSIYKWIGNSSTPEEDKAEKIAELSRLADLFHEADVSRPLDMLKMKAFQGRSILDLFKSGEPYTHLASVLVKESKAVDAAYVKSGLAQVKSVRTDDWKSSISIPYSDEA